MSKATNPYGDGFTSEKIVDAIIDKYKPDAVAIEELFFNQNITTGIAVAEARGVILCTAAKKIDKDPAKYLKGAEENLNVVEIGGRKLGKSKEYKNLSQFAKMLPDSIVFGVAKAMLTIALIPPILKYVFHVEKKPKTKPQQVAQNQKMDFCDKPVFQQFKGGLK